MNIQIIEQYPQAFQKRTADSHKGDYGTLALIGGSTGMSGALILAASAALLTGCGRVHAAFCQTALPAPWIDAYPEIMLATAADILHNPSIDTWAIGCGMGQHPDAHHTLRQTLDHSRARHQPILLDADALNLLARDPDLQTALAAHTACAVLTPHPAEAARLLTCDTRAIQANRAHSAQALAAQYRAWVVLKGHHTLIASPEGHLITNPSGNAALATAGSGDVLTGMIAALLAQKIPPEHAIPAAVWLHGAAADQLMIHNIPLAGLRASEIAPIARHIRQQLTHLACKADAK